MRLKPITTLLIVILLLWQAPSLAATRSAEMTIYNNTKKAVEVSVEVAESFEERSQGLMHRKALIEREGMFFISTDKKEWSIWMKDMLIPLDIIFISRGLRVVSYIKDAKPCKALPCERYNPDSPARYVLEVKAGFIEKYGIKKGSVIEIRE